MRVEMGKESVSCLESQLLRFAEERLKDRERAHSEIQEKSPERGGTVSRMKYGRLWIDRDDGATRVSV